MTSIGNVMGIPRLTKLEMQVMEALWAGGALSVREIQETFADKDRPAYTTVQTMVYRLEAKKAVRRLKKIGNAHIFEAAITREGAQHRLIDDFLGFFGGKSQPVMARLIETGRLTLDDVKEAEQLLKELERRRKMDAAANHIWQSTVVAAGAAALVWMCRQNRASVRHAIWLAASMKFLVPFALLAAVARALPWPPASLPQSGAVAAVTVMFNAVGVAGGVRDVVAGCCSACGARHARRACALGVGVDASGGHRAWSGRLSPTDRCSTRSDAPSARRASGRPRRS